MEGDKSDHSSNSNLSYSNDSDDDKKTLLSLNFSDEFSISLKDKIENYRESIFNARNSLNAKEKITNEYKINVKELEERISLKDSELNTLCSSVNTFYYELNENIRKSITYDDVFQDVRSRLQQKVKNTQKTVIKSELEYIIKQHQLLALKDYAKNIEKANEIETMYLEYIKKMAENQKIIIKSPVFQRKIKDAEEIRNFYDFLNINFSINQNLNITSSVSKLKTKLKQVLQSEYNFWSLSKVFHESKSEIQQNFVERSAMIRENTRKRLSGLSKTKCSKILDLKDEIEKAGILKMPDFSTKPTLLLGIKVYSKHLDYLHHRIARLRRKHNRLQKRINSNSRKLASAELKLGRLKSNYFLKEL